jgi:hypothetical protein
MASRAPHGLAFRGADRAGRFLALSDGRDPRPRSFGRRVLGAGLRRDRPKPLIGCLGAHRVSPGLHGVTVSPRASLGHPRAILAPAETRRGTRGCSRGTSSA